MYINTFLRNHHQPLDVKKAVDVLDNFLRSLLDKHAPERTVLATLRPNAPWYTSSLHESKQRKRQCERKYLSTRLEVHRQIYREQCSLYLSELNLAKAEFYKTKITDSDQNQLFRLVDGLRLFHIKSEPPLPSCESFQALAQQFSLYFSTKIQKLWEQLPPSTLMDNVISDSNISTFCLNQFECVSEDLVSRIICQSASKSCQLDPIPTCLLKESPAMLITAITNLINLSFENGVFPESFKKALIRPLLKKTKLDPNDLSNYRPVANLAFISKTLERVVVTQLKEHLECNGLFPKMQSAYRSKHSTETAILRVFNDILRSIDNHHEVVLVLLDLSSAFDTLDHDVLLDRLQRRFGIGCSALS
jgi:hypothetical protein